MPVQVQPVQVRGEVLHRRRVGAYYLLEVAAGAIAEQARPGQFVAVSVGGPASSMLLRRSFALYRATPTGIYSGTVQFVVGVHGRGTEWLAGVRQGDPLDLVGPLGTPFRLPTTPVGCLLVGGGYGSAPLFPLAEALRGVECKVDLLLGASTADRLFGELEAKRTAGAVTLTTDDGSAGVRGTVVDVLPDELERTGALAVYACGPMGMLRAVGAVAQSYGLPCQVAVEESMACGIGVCMTCVLPVVGADGLTRMTRSCVEGPVFAHERIRWDDVGTVPADAVGAPAAQPAATGAPAEPVPVGGPAEPAAAGAPAAEPAEVGVPAAPPAGGPA